MGLQFGDPPIVARSKLFVSLSLIQRGQLRLAKKIIRQQYEVAKQEEEYDPRLKKMCIGIWMKLQYAYQLKSQNKMSTRKELLNKPQPSDYLNVFIVQKYRNHGKIIIHSLLTYLKINRKMNT